MCPNMNLGSIGTVIVASASTLHCFAGNQLFSCGSYIFLASILPLLQKEVCLFIKLCMPFLTPELLTQLRMLCSYHCQHCFHVSMDGKQLFSSRSCKCCMVFSHKEFCIPYFRCVFPTLITSRLLEKRMRLWIGKRHLIWSNTNNINWPEGLLYLVDLMRLPHGCPKCFPA